MYHYVRNFWHITILAADATPSVSPPSPAGGIPIATERDTKSQPAVCYYLQVHRSSGSRSRPVLKYYSSQCLLLTLLCCAFGASWTLGSRFTYTHQVHRLFTNISPPIVNPIAKLAILSRRLQDPSYAPSIIVSPCARPTPDVVQQAIDLSTPPQSQLSSLSQSTAVLPGCGRITCSTRISIQFPEDDG
jgi:hypothetical protein